MALLEWVAAMEIICKDSAGGDKRNSAHYRHNGPSETICTFMRNIKREI